MGTLYYGDNLDVLRRYIKDKSVDLVYLDPPFNSAQNYNAFFQEKDGSAAASQIHAFEDTWHWDIETKKAYDAVTEQPGKVSDVMQAFNTFLGGNDMMAYLTMMSSRLVELRRVLKPTGSLQPPTGPMETEAASAGFYEHKTIKQKYPRLQLRTVKKLMEGKGIERPSTVAATDETFKRAPKSKAKTDEQADLQL
jgi:hypothetical protein